jgi:hypothetical protein
VPRVEQRNGRTVTFVSSPMGDLGLVSPDETTHVMAAGARLDAVLATLGGGPTIDGSPLLVALASVPAGAVVGAANIPESLAGMLTEGLAMFAGGKPIPPPRTIAGSMSLGDAIGLAASVTMADDASAQTLESVINTAISGAKTMVAAMAQEPMAKMIKPVLDSIGVSRNGAVVAVHVRITQEVIQQSMGARHGRSRGGATP